MHGAKIKQNANRSKEVKTISGILLSALDMEDEIAHSIYRDYLDRRHWPAEIKEEIFEEIEKNLTVLLNDTQRHRNMIKALQSRLETHDRSCNQTKTSR